MRECGTVVLNCSAKSESGQTFLPVFHLRRLSVARPVLASLRLELKFRN
jgi:hypothetical protein